MSSALLPSFVCAVVLYAAEGVLLPAVAPAQSDKASALDRQVVKLHQAGSIAEAITLAKRSLELRENAKPPIPVDIALSRSNLAELYRMQGKLTDAERLAEDALAIRRRELPGGHRDIAQSLNILGSIYQSQGQLLKAEPLLKEALELREKARLPYDIGTSLQNLAGLYQAQGRIAEGGELFKRSLEIRREAVRQRYERAKRRLAQGYVETDDEIFGRVVALVDMARALDNLAANLVLQRKVTQAEALYQEALRIRRATLPRNHRDIGGNLNNLASLYREEERYSDAAPLFEEALEIKKVSLPVGHPDIAVALDNLGSLYMKQGRLADAERLHSEALEIRLKALPDGHPSIAESYSNLSGVAALRQDWPSALDYARKATRLRVERSVQESVPCPGARKGEVEQNTAYFRFHVLAAHRVGAVDAAMREESYEMAQWAQRTAASAALSEMAARKADGAGDLSDLVRAQQDLGHQSCAADRRLSDARSSANVPLTNEVLGEIAGLDEKLKANAAKIAGLSPTYAELTNSVPLSIADTQALLGANEVLIQFLDTPEWYGIQPETFVWAISKSDPPRWAKLSRPQTAIDGTVRALRCGLDSAAWVGAGSAWCRTALGLEAEARPQTLPFDPARAHALYQHLFGQVEDLIKDKHLLIVPSGPLQQLPFHLLVTEQPENGTKAAWLMRRHAITVLPSVASLKALRGDLRPAAARRPYTVLANPLLDGESESDRAAASVARLMIDCATVRQVQAFLPTTGNFMGAIGGGSVKETFGLQRLRRWKPVPLTAVLACEVAKALGAADDDVLLGARATETRVKALSASGQLAAYAVVNFATHAAVAGELMAGAEPGLVLTPPKTGTQEDDGYLSASEVAGLKLDADWVILSACNTAAGGAADAEPLSGLARVFFYAGARALLVSHWYVREDAAVALVTKALSAMSADKTVGRAEAMRRAMVALADSADPVLAHPSYWAPFVVVGEGGAGG